MKMNYEDGWFLENFFVVVVGIYIDLHPKIPHALYNLDCFNECTTPSHFFVYIGIGTMYIHIISS